MKKALLILLATVTVIGGCSRDAAETAETTTTMTTSTMETTSVPAAPAETGTLLTLDAPASATDTASARTTSAAESASPAPAVPATATAAPATPPAEVAEAAPRESEVPQPMTSAASDTASGEGQAIFRAKCTGCHGADGKKTINGVTLASKATQSKTDAELVKIVREGAGKMSAVGHRKAALNDAQATAVVTYVKSLK